MTLCNTASTQRWFRDNAAPTGASIADALLFATAAVSRKMESPGPITGTEADVYDYIHTFYRE